MNNKQIDKLIKAGDRGQWRVSRGLYFRLFPTGKSSWQVRYTFQGKRKWYTLKGSYPHLTIAEAKRKTADILHQAECGTDPFAERRAHQLEDIKTVDELFHDWYEKDLTRRLKHPKVPLRDYNNHIASHIGKMRVREVSPRHVRSIIEAVCAKGYPTKANDVLDRLRQLFRHALKLQLIEYSPAQAFEYADAGGKEQSRSRALSRDELKTVFRLFREHHRSFTRDNYLACALLVTLGVRKEELCQATWDEFDSDGHWTLSAERSKTGVAMTIPLPESCWRWLDELRVRACGSDYVFPARRQSKKPHVSSDTLNSAVNQLFGIVPKNRKSIPQNVMAEHGIEHFVIHDFRRTFRTLLSELGVAPHIAERCLNHKLKGVEGIYNRHDYMEERREALAKLAAVIDPIVDPEKCQIISLVREAS